MYAFLSIFVICLTSIAITAIKCHKDVKKYEICISKNDKIKEINL